jgi:hypothetical protein
LNDDAAVFLLPGPDAFKEFVASDIMARFAFFLPELFLDLHLGGDAGVIGAGEPEDLLAIHTRFAAENILNGVVENVTHVKHAGDIRWRNDNGIRRTLVADTRGIGDETFSVQPELVPFVFHRLRFVSFWDVGHGNSMTDECRGGLLKLKS